MSAEVTIALGVAGRVLANIACADNPRLGAGLVGLANGFAIHRAWLADTLFDPFTLLVLAAGVVFDHKLYAGGFEEAATELLACGLGVVLADIVPDLWYDLVGESFRKELAMELDAMGLGGLVGDTYDSSSDVDDRSDAGSVVSRSSRRTGSSVTVRPSASGSRRREVPRAHPPVSTITRSSRVTFDESSITQSQGSDADVEEYNDHERELGTNGDGHSGSGPDDLYMEPSTTSTSSRTETEREANGRERPQATRRPSILRKLNIPGQDATTAGATTTLPTLSSELTSSESATSSRTRLTNDGETTPRATTYAPADLTPHSGFELPSTSMGAGPSFPEPDLSSTATTTGSYDYSPRVVPPSEPTPDLSTSVALPEPIHLPDPSPISTDSMVSERTINPEGRHEEHNHDHRHGILSSIMNVPIAPPSEGNSYHLHKNGHLDSSISGRPRSRSQSRSKERTRSRSPFSPRPQPPFGPRPQPPPYHGSPYHGSPSPDPASQAASGMYGPQSFMSESFEDSTIDVRPLTRDEALQRIEEAWRNVEKKKHRRLNILVRHDDDELQTGARKNSTFHLMEDLENLRFNFKIRPGIIIVTSRSRG